jgi:dephospho-CoA kinase
MLRVGLTGGISTGKSTVGLMFVELGCHLIDSDRITHQLLEPGQAVHANVIHEFGQRILAPDGTIDRRALGSIVFNDAQSRDRLNQLVHPAVIQRQQRWLNEVEIKDPSGIAIVDAALMIEVGTYKNYDRIIVVTCSPAVQKRRLSARSGLSEDQIEARIRAQMPMEEKIKFADFVIDNSGDLGATRRQVEEVNSRLLELAAGTSGRNRS